jgi:hypothetical protein
MKIHGKRADGVLCLNIGGGVGVLVKGQLASPATDLGVLDRLHGPFSDVAVTQAERLETRRMLNATRMAPLSTFHLGDRSKYPGGKYPNEADGASSSGSSGSSKLSNKSSTAELSRVGVARAYAAKNAHDAAYKAHEKAAAAIERGSKNADALRRAAWKASKAAEKAGMQATEVSTYDNFPQGQYNGDNERGDVEALDEMSQDYMAAEDSDATDHQAAAENHNDAVSVASSVAKWYKSAEKRPLETWQKSGKSGSDVDSAAADAMKEFQQTGRVSKATASRLEKENVSATPNETWISDTRLREKAYADARAGKSWFKDGSTSAKKDKIASIVKAHKK